MKTIQGSIPAIITPMQDDGSLDLPGLRRLLDWHISRRHGRRRHRWYVGRIADGQL
jgi:dihydrodipicolinate synthase/N-acetylneuraminate lyase